MSDTADFFRARLDKMVDHKHPLVAPSKRLPWSAIELALAPRLRPPARNRARRPERRNLTGRCSSPNLQRHHLPRLMHLGAGLGARAAMAARCVAHQNG